MFILLLDDRPRPVNICLSPHIVNENQPAGTVIGQVIIDDSSSPILTCSKQHCCPDNGRHFHYECNIDNTEENAILPDLYKNVTALFLLDEGFRLRTRVKLNYSDFANSNGSVDIQVSCQDTRHPLHFIGSSVRVTVAGKRSQNHHLPKGSYVNILDKRRIVPWESTVEEVLFE